MWHQESRMMAKGLVLREVPLLCEDKSPAVRGQVPCCAGTSPLLCGDKSPAVRGQAPRRREMHSGSYGLSEVQVSPQRLFDEIATFDCSGCLARI
jgi:hypothetical protein